MKRMNLSTTINFLLGLQMQMKINHWQTKSHARHEAFGDFYDKMDEHIDMFVEAAIGRYGEFRLSDEDKDIPLYNLSELNLKMLIKVVIESLNMLKEQLSEEDTDLLNIRDEMIAELNKLSYLLSRK